MNIYSDSSKEYVFIKIPYKQEVNSLNTNISSLGCNNWSPPLAFEDIVGNQQIGLF